MLEFSLVSTLDDNTYALAADVLAVEGRIRYLKDWDQEIVAQLKARKVDEQIDPLVFRRGTESFVLRAQRVAAGKTRRFDYTKLKRTRPELYRNYVTETPPAQPVKLTFRAAGRMTSTSKTWADLRSRGWVSADTRWGEQRRSEREHVSARTYAMLLQDVRNWSKPLDEKRSKLRAELSGLLVPDTAVLENVEYGDGLIVPALNPPKREIDLNMAERHAVLKDFMKETARAESVRWVFQSEHEVFGDDPEGDQWGD